MTRQQLGLLSSTRVTATLEGEFVVFLIGMRINQPWRVSAWLPVARAMPRMLTELQRQPELGLLGSHGAGLSLIQYWRSVEHLQAYARSREHEHLPAWKAFNQNARRAEGAVGIWHETYHIAPGQWETIYVNMPPHGLGRASAVVPVGTGQHSAAERMVAAASPQP